MNFKIFISLSIYIFSLLVGSQIQAQGINFLHSWEKAQEKAKAENKIIFVDAYAVWCGPCKRLAKNVFPQKEVGKFFNDHFVSVKLDMEKAEGKKFGKKYPVSAFPTLFFIAPDGETIHKIKGAPRSAEALLAQANMAVKKYDPSGDMQELYEKGERGHGFMTNYILALKTGGHETGKVANEFIDTQEDLNKDDNLRFISAAVYSIDSRIYEIFISKKSQMEKLLGKNDVEMTISDASTRTVNRAIEYEVEEMLILAQGEMKKHIPKRAKSFKYHTNMKYAMALNKPSMYLKSVKVYAKDKVNGNIKKQSELANKIFLTFPNDISCMKYAAKLMKKPAKIGGDSIYNLLYAQILNKLGKSSKAKEEAQKALELAKENKKNTRQIKQFIQLLS